MIDRAWGPSAFPMTRTPFLASGPRAGPKDPKSLKDLEREARPSWESSLEECPRAARHSQEIDHMLLFRRGSYPRVDAAQDHGALSACQGTRAASRKSLSNSMSQRDHLPTGPPGPGLWDFN